MPIFISYSHQDKDFVDGLATALVQHRARVWLDRWELSVGDSLIERIQSAITEASALIVVLSKASVESEWCKKEISSGLLRELEEKRVVVLPVLIEDCDIPLFLRDKLYADFRAGFDDGLKVTLEAIATVTSDTMGRVGSSTNHFDWSIDHGFEDGSYFLRVTLLELSENNPYSVLTEIVALANEEGTKRQKEYANRGFEGFGKLLVVAALAGMVAEHETILRLKDSRPQTTGFTMHYPKTGITYDMRMTARWLGEDTGKDVLIDCTGQLESILEAMKASRRPLSKDEFESLADLIAS